MKRCQSTLASTRIEASHTPNVFSVSRGEAIVSDHILPKGEFGAGEFGPGDPGGVAPFRDEFKEPEEDFFSDFWN